jgi:uncharacterized membrane protein YqiK
MSSGIDVDVRFDHPAAAQAIRVLNITIVDIEALLKRRRQRKHDLSGDWEGPAADWYEDRFSALEVVSAVVVEHLRETSRAIAAKQSAATHAQAQRVAARAERARQQREAELARQRADAERAEAQKKAAADEAAKSATANTTSKPTSTTAIGKAA